MATASSTPDVLYKKLSSQVPSVLELDLLRAVLGREAGARAADILAAARTLDLDPLARCSHQFGLPEALVLERAAHWAGVGFRATVPAIDADNLLLPRLDALASVRVLRSGGNGSHSLMLSPRFEEIVLLRRRIEEQPEIAQEICLVPASALRTALVGCCGEMLLDEARQRLARQWPKATAALDLEPATRRLLVGGLAGVSLVPMLAPFLLPEILLPLTFALLGIPAGIRFWAAVAEPEGLPPLRLLSDAELPVYSVLIPLCNEAHMVPQLGRAMRRLDYPAEKLEILFVVEAASEATVAAVEMLLDDSRFGLIVVPDALPRTKPKALNFALPLLRGEHVVVFDAEDVPDADQLRLAASAFAALPEIECLQAELVIETGRENLLTALFAGEYAGLFGLLLPLLGRLHLPMPLGGTSNHFRTARLLQLGGWDAHNVTEDADLGVRLARMGWRTLALPSATAEEAPVSIAAWMRQRTRWMKGWMQTFIVHNRRAGELLADTGLRSFLFFELFVGGMITASLLHTVFLVSVVVRLILGESFALTDPWDLLSMLILVTGYGASLALVLAGLVRRRQWRLLLPQLLVPLYWMLHSVAAVCAARELLIRPYFWSKTAHGQTRLRRRIEP